MPDEFILRTGLTSLLTSAETWIAVTYLAGMFLVLAFRPQQIAAPSSFRLSYILFALYFIVPSSLMAIVWLTLLGSANGGGGQIHLVMFQMFGIVGKVLLGLSIFFAFGSMIPPRTSGFPSAKRTESEESGFYEKRGGESN
jgi:hypothetical protein